MREYDVFGRKISKLRPFYFIIVIFIVIIPLNLVMNYFQQQTLDELNDEYRSLNAQINRLIDASELDATDEEIHMGMIYSGFEDDGFNIYIQERIETIMYESDLAHPASLDISIQNDVTSPFMTSMSEDIKVNKINLVIETTDINDVIDFLNTLVNQDKLYYVHTFNYSLLTNGDYRVTTEVYSFYLDA